MQHFATKALLTAAITSLGFAGIASAADMQMPIKAPPPILTFNWSGFYIGGFVGGAFADGNAVAGEPTSATGGAYNGTLLPTSYGLKSGFLGGGTIGYNWQAPGSSYVFGLEGEAGYLHVRGSRQDVGAAAANLAAIDSVDSTRFGDAYGVIAGRIGYTWDRMLLYAKGGVAFVNNSNGFNDSCIGIGAPGCGPGFLVTNQSNTVVTYALGAGLEYAFNNNWSLKGEYLYLGTQQNVTAVGTSVAAPANVVFTHTFSDPGLHTLKIGLNYRFGGPVVAKY